MQTNANEHFYPSFGSNTKNIFFACIMLPVKLGMSKKIDLTDIRSETRNFEFTEPGFLDLDLDLIFRPEFFWIWI